MGHDLATAPRRASIAMTGQFASLDEDLTGAENLALIPRLWGFGRRIARGRAKAMLAAFDLADAAGRSRTTRAACGGGSTSPPRWW